MPQESILTPALDGQQGAMVKANPAETMLPPILLQYWYMVLRWKLTIAAIIVAMLCFGIIATLLMSPKYTAGARIEISRDQKNITKVEGIESSDAGRDLEFYQTQYSLLEARSLAARVARQLRLASDDSFFAAHGAKRPEAGAGEVQGGRGQRLNDENAAINLLMAHINIQPVRGSSLVDIRYTSGSPELSARVANAWTEQFISRSIARRFESTAEARKFLEERLASLRTRLEQSERDVVNYASQKGIVTLSRQQGPDGHTSSERTLAAADLEALNEALTKAIADRIAAESRARTDGPSEAQVSSISLGALRQKRAEIAAEKAKALVQFEPSYPAVRALTQQLQALDQSIATEVARLSGSDATSYSEAVKRENELSNRVNQLKARIGLQQRDSIQYAIYQREADTNRQLYEALLQRYKEIGVAGVAANNISIVDAAEVPTRPSSPILLLNIAVSLVAGVILAGLATLALDQIDEGVREPSQVNRLLQVPLLGSIPDLTDEETPVLTLRDSKSIMSEAYLSVRSNLAFSTNHGVPRSLMVTSTRPAEGKSTTSLALAMVIARTGKRVLLIDADLRRPSIHRVLGVSNKEGVSNVLAGEDNWQRLVLALDTNNLSLLTAGPTPPSASELLSSERMTIFIGQALEAFDHVVIDSPPILGLADAPLLSRAVEGCIFVVEAEGVAVRGAKAALGRLQAVHAHIFGAVLTKLKARQASYGYGYNYGTAYGEYRTDD